MSITTVGDVTAKGKNIRALFHISSLRFYHAFFSSAEEQTFNREFYFVVKNLVILLALVSLAKI